MWFCESCSVLPGSSGLVCGFPFLWFPRGPFSPQCSASGSCKMESLLWAQARRRREAMLHSEGARSSKNQSNIQSGWEPSKYQPGLSGLYSTWQTETNSLSTQLHTPGWLTWIISCIAYCAICLNKCNNFCFGLFKTTFAVFTTEIINHVAIAVQYSK